MPQLYGPHAGNVILGNASREIMRQEIAAAGATSIKLMWNEHRRADAEYFRNMGLQIIVRIFGEGFPYSSDVADAIEEFKGVCDWIEVGNEPHPTAQYPGWEWAMWNHAVYLDVAWHQNHAAAHAAGIRLAFPGWRGNDEPFQPRDEHGHLITLSPALVARLKQVYGLYDGASAHAYGSVVLESLQLERLKRWAAEFPDKPLLLTEVGIAANDLLARPSNPSRYPRSRIRKGERLGTFAAEVFKAIPQAECFIVFISSCSTSEWGYFEPGQGYVPNGSHGYWLGLEGWHALGKAIREQRAA